LGETEDLILALYGAFRRQDLDVVVGGMHPDATFKPCVERSDVSWT